MSTPKLPLILNIQRLINERCKNALSQNLNKGIPLRHSSTVSMSYIDISDYGKGNMTIVAMK